jgi:hypothetical protein
MDDVGKKGDRHQMDDLTEEAKLTGELEARLPAATFQNLVSKAESLTHPTERLAYLTKVASRIGTYTRLVEEAERIVHTGPHSADIHANGKVRKDIPVNWNVLSHIALTAGWVRTGYTRLDRDNAERPTITTGTEELHKSVMHSPDPAAALDVDKVELIVLYESDGAQFLPRVRSVEVLEFKRNGEVMDLPAPTRDGVYRWLGTNGYVPAMEEFRWLDRHEGRRRRRQVYVYRPRERLPERRLSHAEAWDLTRGFSYRDL